MSMPKAMRDMMNEAGFEFNTFRCELRRQGETDFYMFTTYIKPQDDASKMKFRDRFEIHVEPMAAIIRDIVGIPGIRNEADAKAVNSMLFAVSRATTWKDDLAKMNAMADMNDEDVLACADGKDELIDLISKSVVKCRRECHRAYEESGRIQDKEL